jgi:hypothetical protein
MSISINEFLERIVNKLPFEQSTSMYNASYKYTMKKFRQSLIDVIIKYQQTMNNTSSNGSENNELSEMISAISPDDIDKFLNYQMQITHHPHVQQRITEIAAIPLVEQKSPEWFKLREGMISASDAGYFLKKCGAARAVDTLRLKLGLKSYPNSGAASLTHGNTYEDITRAIYESRNQVEVAEYGILSSPTGCIGASPDGIVVKCLNDTFDCKSRLGRLLEIKNPYSREIDETIKPEYMVQILQQQYTTQLPVCDFVETTIVDKYSTTSAGNYKAYETLNDMLTDQLEKTASCVNWQSRIKNHNIPVDNLNKFGNEKGLLVWYQKVITSSDTRNKYVIYPLQIKYERLEIEKWIVDTNSTQFKDGFMFKEVKYWRLDVYAEKTVVYDQGLFEGEYVPRLCDIWNVICKCRDLQKKSSMDIIAYIEDMENQKDNPFYNENKRKKKIKSTTSTASITNVISFGKSNNNIELDF